MLIHHIFPKHLGRLTYNTLLKRYEITEHGIMYQLTEQQAQSITLEYRSVAEWYENLSRFTKMQVCLQKVNK